MTSAKPSATLGFVDRVDEMKRILDALNVASTGKGKLLLVRGEAGSGKTRLLEEAAAEAEKQGFRIGFGTALAESVVPYHAWKEVLEGMGLDAILKEAPPPKLLGLYLIASDGGIRIKVEREEMDTGLAPLVDMIAESVRKSESQQENAEDGTISHDIYRSVVERRPSSSLGAIVEGQEDEAFLVDLKELADTTESMLGDPQQVGVDDAIEAPMRELLESEKYEGIDYTKDDPKLRQAKLFEHVTLGLSRKAEARSLCVAIDDLQWADPSSLALLHYVSRNLRESGILLLGTYRAEEAEARPHLRDALKGMEEEELLAEMDLKGLSREDLADLAESFIGSHDLHDDLLDLLWQETQGNPLFVREVLHGLEDDEAIAVQGAAKRLVRPLDQLAVPERVREVIRARLDRLPKADRHLLDVAATCGTRFTTALVAKVAGEAEGQVLNGLNSIAQVHGLLRSTSSGFAFDHSAVQEVLYDSMAPDARQAYHKEAAEWLELAGGPIEDIAEHYYRAKDSRAAQRLCQLAEEARERYANDEAIRFYQEALEFEGNAHDRMKVFRNLGGIYSLIGDHDRSIQACKNALESAGEKRIRAGIMVRIGDAFKSKGEFDDALESFKGALDLVEGEACKEESQAYNGIGMVYYHKGESDKGLEDLDRGLAIAGEIGDRDLRGDCLNNIGLVHMGLGNYDVALKNFKKNLGIKDEIGDERNAAGCMHNIAYVLCDQGSYNEALDYLRRAVRISERIGHLRFLGNHLNHIGIIYMEWGDYDQAHKYFAKNLAIKERIGEQEGVATGLNNIGVVYRDLGDYDRALEYFEKGNKILRKTGSRWWLAESYNYVGEAHLEKGNIENALECANQAISLSKETGRKKDIGWARNLFGLIYREQRKWHEAKESFEESVAIFEEIGFVSGEADSHYEFGLMWKKKGDLAKAMEHLGVSVKLFEELKAEKRVKRAKDEYIAVREELSCDS